MASTKKKGQFAFMQSAGVALVVITITLAFGALILDSVRDNVTSQNATDIIIQGSNGLFNMGTFLPIIAIIVAVVIILGLVFLIQQRRGGGV